MMRAAFYSRTVVNLLRPDVPLGCTLHAPSGDVQPIWEVAQRYREADVPVVLVAGERYGTGSSRDWAAKGPRLLGIKAAIAESFERIHRSNLIGMGIVPLVFKAGENLSTLGLSGSETFDIPGIGPDLRLRQELSVKATADDGKSTEFKVICRIDTPAELDYYRHGGILEYVLRQLLAN
jgi:aconitate hydratase